MEVYVTKEYIAFVLALWVGSVGSAEWGWPVWATISFMCFFLIYAGHEWIHVWICEINSLDVEYVSLATGGETEISFSVDEADPEKDRKAADVYLAGVAWDSILYTVSVFSSIFYGYLSNETIPITFGLSLILLLIFNLAMPGSDWQNYVKRSHMRA